VLTNTRLPVQLNRPPAGRGDVAVTEINGLARQFPEILHDHPRTFSVGARIDAHARVHREVRVSLARAAPDRSDLSHCIGLPGNCGVKHRGLKYAVNFPSLAAFIQQRIRHAYRRQRPTPLPSRTAESRHQSQLGVDGLDAAHARSLWPLAAGVTSPFCSGRLPDTEIRPAPRLTLPQCSRRRATH
jgi:hypothetical protein